MTQSVLLTGATGFVGSHVQPALARAGYDVRCATRDLARARRERPGLDWVHLDLCDPATVGTALAGVRSALYLVHSMAQGAGYEQREFESARVFAREAEAAGLERIVYLGGVVPQGRPSLHLKSRIAAGEALRAGRVPVFELRAAMIVGEGSTSFRIVRDLAARLPAMILPRWLANLSEPVAIDDVVFALCETLSLPVSFAGTYGIPGPEALTGVDVLLRIAKLLGMRPLIMNVPVLSPRVSSYWLKFVTGADYAVARELVDGLSNDLLATGRSLWQLFPQHALVPFDEAVRRALEREQRPTRGQAIVERAVARIARPAH